MRSGSSERVTHATVVRHVVIEDLGYLGEALTQGGVSFSYVDAQSLAGNVPYARGPLVVLGGPMAAYEVDRYPYLVDVIEVIRAHLSADLPVLGICLGAQLLAAAAGATVYAGTRGKEIGWAPVQLTEAGAADPLWDGFPRRFQTFHWHGDTFEVPAGGQVLARTEGYVQAFRLGRQACGVQFHPEVVPQELESWIRKYRLELERERLSSQDVLAVPDESTHRELAHRFGDNVAQWFQATAG